MKSLNLFARVFISALVGTVVCLSVGGWAAAKVQEQDPQILDKIQSKYNVVIHSKSVTSSKKRGREIEPSSTGSWTFTTPITDLEIATFNGNISVRKTPRNDVLVTALGSDVPRGLVQVRFENGELSIHEAEDVSDLQLSIEIPESYQIKNGNLKSVSGEIEIKDLSFESLRVTNVSGSLELENVQANELQGKTVSGDFELKNIKGSSGTLKTVSGDVELKKFPRSDYHFTVKTVSGKVANTYPSNASAAYKISITSVSGDIEID